MLAPELMPILLMWVAMLEISCDSALSTDKTGHKHTSYQWEAEIRNGRLHFEWCLCDETKSFQRQFAQQASKMKPGIALQ